MKKLLDYLARPVLELADRIPYKRYVYFTAGVLIACLVLMAAIFCNAPVWAALIISAIAVNLAAFWKEYWHDATPEPRDIVTAVLGGGVVWITVLLLMLVEFLKG